MIKCLVLSLPYIINFFPNDTRALNTISNGCLLPDGLNMQKLLPKLGDKTIVAVMPNKGKLSLFK